MYNVSTMHTSKKKNRKNSDKFISFILAIHRVLEHCKSCFEYRIYFIYVLQKSYTLIYSIPSFINKF